LNGIVFAKEFTNKSESHKKDVTKIMLNMVNSSTYNHIISDNEAVFNLFNKNNTAKLYRYIYSC
jgi:carotenoid cleavage dioxygenase-like enzyme